MMKEIIILLLLFATASAGKIKVYYFLIDFTVLGGCVHKRKSSAVWATYDLPYLSLNDYF